MPPSGINHVKMLDVGHQLPSGDGKPLVLQKTLDAGPTLASVVNFDHYLTDKKPVPGFDACQDVFFSAFGVDLEQVDTVDRMLVEKSRQSAHATGNSFRLLKISSHQFRYRIQAP